MQTSINTYFNYMVFLINKHYWTDTIITVNINYTNNRELLVAREKQRVEKFLLSRLPIIKQKTTVYPEVLLYSKFNEENWIFIPMTDLKISFLDLRY